MALSAHASERIEEPGSGSGPPEQDGGFSLVELLVVVLILAVLVAISIPVYLGAQQRGRDRAAQTTARQALGSAKVVFQIDEDYSAVDVERLEEAEPGLRFLPGPVPSTGPANVSVDAPDSVTFIASVWSLSGSCFYLQDRSVPVTGGTSYAVRTPSQGPDCSADNTADLTFGPGW